MLRWMSAMGGGIALGLGSGTAPSWMSLALFGAIISSLLRGCVTLGVLVAMSSPLALGASGEASQQDVGAKPLQMLVQHDQVLRRWLDSHSDLRPVRMDDCEDRWVDSAGKEHVEPCQRLVQGLRAWTKDPTANPFYARGDFNGDGAEDFAVVLTGMRPSRTGAKSATVVVFNGPFNAVGVANPAFSMIGRSVSETFLGYGPPRGKPWHLIIGRPESEGRPLVWLNGKYILR